MGLQFGVSYMGGDYEYVRVRRWPFSIGRSPGNDLCLSNSALISRRHVRVFKDEAGYHLVARGRNPTYLNGNLVVPNQPVALHPGDRIELPDYVLTVRNSGHNQVITATVNVEVVSTTAIITRRIASELGVSRWSVDAIHDWLRTGQGRQIRIRHERVALCLPERMNLQELEQRLALFDELISELDPQALEIELVNPLPFHARPDEASR